MRAINPILGPLLWALIILPIPSVGELLPPDPPRLYMPLVVSDLPTRSGSLLLSALYYDGYLVDEPDEAFQITNPLAGRVELAGWRVTDGARRAVFPVGMTLGPGERLWCARDAAAFRVVFGQPARCEYALDGDPAVPNMTGAALRFANTGGRVILERPDGSQADVLVYEGGDPGAGWEGAPLFPYRPTTAFAAEGQVLYRKLDPHTGMPLPDTNTPADWAADPGDLYEGRRVRFPGWDLEARLVPATCSADARLEVIVAPDHAYEALQQLLRAARTSIRFEGYSLESPSLAETLAAQAAAGVRVEIMLEGAPPGGVTDAQRWAVQQIVAAGGRVHYLRSDTATGIRKRYLYQHGKTWLLDDRLAVIGSENPSPESFPGDDKADGTLGRRGVMVATDAPCVVEAIREVIELDVAPTQHRDVWAWDANDPVLGVPPPGYVPTREEGGSGYAVVAQAPLVITGQQTYQVVTAPEHAMRADDGLLGLARRAGAGDTLLIEQLYEHTYWGAESSNVAADPNPRLVAYVNAARRGARVRVLFDAFFDDLKSPRSNLRTVEYLNAIARAEGLDLEARRRNPTGAGIHNKMALAEIGGRGWVMVGSMNGGEASAKLSREVNVLIGSDAAYGYLAEVFWRDWE